MHGSAEGVTPCPGHRGIADMPVPCRAVRPIALVVFSSRVFLCKAGCFVFLVRLFGIDYDAAVSYMDRHPCNQMRKLWDWAEVVKLLRNPECYRSQPPEQDPLPSRPLKSHA